MALNKSSKIKTSDLEFVSVADEAIDWENTYPDIVEEDKKRSKFRDDRDYSKVAFKADEEPTVLVFKSPRVIDNAVKIRDTMIQCSEFKEGMSEEEAGRSFKVSEACMRLFRTCFVGYKDGFKGKLVKNRINGQIPEDFIAAMFEQGIIEESGTLLIKENSSKKN
jgi:hypothetical protein